MKYVIILRIDQATGMWVGLLRCLQPLSVSPETAKLTLSSLGPLSDSLPSSRLLKFPPLEEGLGDFLLSWRSLGGSRVKFSNLIFLFCYLSSL